MKNSLLITAAILAYCILITANCFSQGTAINANGANPDNSAILDAASTSKGFLLPRMTTSERNAIVSPAQSLQLFNTDVNCLQIFINSVWQNIFCDLGCSSAPPMPGIITGNAAPCQNSTGITYYIAQVAGATSYNWSVPAGATIISGQGTTGIVVNFGASSGAVSVTANNNCGVSLPQSLTVTLTTAPSGAGNISGTAAVCQNQQGVSYSVTAVGGATGYVWSYSGTGFTIISGSGTNNITADFSGTATGGNLSVYGYNSCGNGNTSTAFPISVSAIPSTPTANAASGVATSSFTANWSASAGASVYYLDVASDTTFTSILPSYNNLNVGAVLSYNITGLTANTKYFYRVRANNSCGTSGNSNIISQKTANLTANLLAYWKFDEGSGNATDATGNGNTLTNYNSVPYNAAKINNGANFGNVNNHTKALNKAGTGMFGLNASTGHEYTVGFWFKSNADPDGAGVGRVVDIGGTGYITIEYRKNGSDIQFIAITGDAPGIVYTYTFTVGTWYYITLTCGTDNVVRLYINCSQVATGTNAGLFSGENAGVGNANNNPGSNPAGCACVIDELGVWQRQLTISDINCLYNSGSGLQYPF